MIPNLAPGVYSITVVDDNGCTETCQFTIASATPCEVVIDNIILVTASCQTASNGEITIEVSGGIEPYEYSLDCVNYQSENFFTGLTPGPYTVCVRDATGCFVSQNVVVPAGTGPRVRPGLRYPPACADSHAPWPPAAR